MQKMFVIYNSHSGAVTSGAQPVDSASRGAALQLQQHLHKVRPCAGRQNLNDERMHVGAGRVPEEREERTELLHLRQEGAHVLERCLHCMRGSREGE